MEGSTPIYGYLFVSPCLPPPSPHPKRLFLLKTRTMLKIENSPSSKRDNNNSCLHSGCHIWSAFFYTCPIRRARMQARCRYRTRCLLQFSCCPSVRTFRPLTAFNDAPEPQNFFRICPDDCFWGLQSGDWNLRNICQNLSDKYRSSILPWPLLFRFPYCFCFRFSLLFLCTFPLIARDFKGSVKRKTLAFFVVFLVFFIQTSKGWRLRVGQISDKFQSPWLEFVENNRRDKFRPKSGFAADVNAARGRRLLGAFASSLAGDETMGDRLLSTAGTGRSCALPMKMPNHSQMLDASPAPLGPGTPPPPQLKISCT